MQALDRITAALCKWVLIALWLGMGLHLAGCHGHGYATQYEHNMPNLIKVKYGQKERTIFD